MFCSIVFLFINQWLKQVTYYPALTFLRAKSHPLLAEAFSFCESPKTGALVLLGVRQASLLGGPLLCKRCHKRRKAKALKMEKKGKHVPVKKVFASQHFSCPGS